MRKIGEIINNRYISCSFLVAISMLLLISVILLSYLLYQEKNMKIALEDKFNYIRMDTRMIKAYQKTNPSILTAVVENTDKYVEKQEEAEDFINKETSIATSKIKQNATQEVVNIIKKENEEEEKIEKEEPKTSETENVNNNIAVQKEYRGYQATRIYSNSKNRS